MNPRPTAIVTGANRGIGRAIALALARDGFDVAALDLRFDSSDEHPDIPRLQADIEAFGRDCLTLTGDISDLSDHPRFIESIQRRFDRIDLLVNNAGIAPPQRLDLLETTPDNFDRVLNVNLRGTFFFTQQVARAMLNYRAREPDAQPRIIFITSISAVASSVNRAEYCISKAGLSMAARVFADRLAEVGIPVFEVRPGIIATPMTAGVKEKYDRLIAEGLVPQHRWGQPEDMARVVAALARGYFDYSTGAVIDVSGGMNLQRF